MVDSTIMVDTPTTGIRDLSNQAATARVVVDSAGRLVVPAPFRTALGFQERQEVFLALEGATIRMTTAEAALEAAVAEAQALARKRGGGKGGEVETFIAERRAEAAKE